ncbi:MAG: YegP family protein [Undibacterium sp.]|nr:YegP family protein [Undibacterium sp.]
MERSYGLHKNADGQFYFTLTDGNAETILTSELYHAIDSARHGIESVQNNCGADDRYEKKEAANGKYFFNLKAANHQVIGTSRMFASTAMRDNGIASVKMNGITKLINDHTGSSHH